MWWFMDYIINHHISIRAIRIGESLDEYREISFNKDQRFRLYYKSR